MGAAMADVDRKGSIFRAPFAGPRVPAASILFSRLLLAALPPRPLRSPLRRSSCTVLYSRSVWLYCTCTLPQTETVLAHRSDRLHLISTLGAPSSIFCVYNPLQAHVSGFSCTDGSHHASQSHYKPSRPQASPIVPLRLCHLSRPRPTPCFPPYPADIVGLAGTRRALKDASERALVRSVSVTPRTRRVEGAGEAEAGDDVRLCSASAVDGFTKFVERWVGRGEGGDSGGKHMQQDGGENTEDVVEEIREGGSEDTAVGSYGRYRSLVGPQCFSPPNILLILTRI